MDKGIEKSISDMIFDERVDDKGKGENCQNTRDEADEVGKASAKKPKNAFMHFYHAVCKENKGDKKRYLTREVRRELGAKWKSMPAEERAVYEAQAHEHKTCHGTNCGKSNTNSKVTKIDNW